MIITVGLIVCVVLTEKERKQEQDTCSNPSEPQGDLNK